MKRTADGSRPANPEAILRVRYVVALAVIAGVVITGQILAQRELSRRSSDSRTINLSGRQRMLSQKLAKTALAIVSTRQPEERQGYVADLESDLARFRGTHRGLRFGDPEMGLTGRNSDAVKNIFVELEPSFETMVDAAQRILDLLGPAAERPADEDDLAAEVRRLQATEPRFLLVMDRIVYQYDAEALRRIVRMQFTLATLLAVLLATLVLEGLFVFRPAGRQIAGTIGQLRAAESELRQSNTRLGALIRSSPLAIVAFAADGTVRTWNPAAEGLLLWTAEEMLGHAPPPRLAALRAPPSPGGVESRVARRDGRSIDVRVFPAALSGEVDDAVGEMVVVEDVTERKRLEREVTEVSSREQRLLGQDLHDGLGQQLTGIAFIAKTLESKLRNRSVPESEHAARIAAELNEAIIATRDISKLLYPAIVDEAGLAAALRDLALGVENTFAVACSFECSNDPELAGRDRELDVYRIAQEAIRNAVRHGNPERLRIVLDVAADEGILRIDDDGTGFDPGASVGNDGMGLRIMAYRAGRLGGALSVESEPGRGTCVTCRFPLG